MQLYIFLAIFGANTSQNSQDATPLPTPPTMPDDNSNSDLVSPSTKKSFFKRSVEDGMDK